MTTTNDPKKTDTKDKERAARAMLERDRIAQDLSSKAAEEVVQVVMRKDDLLDTWLQKFQLRCSVALSVMRLAVDDVWDLMPLPDVDMHPIQRMNIASACLMVLASETDEALAKAPVSARLSSVILLDKMSQMARDTGQPDDARMLKDRALFIVSTLSDMSDQELSFYGGSAKGLIRQVIDMVRAKREAAAG